MGPVCATGVGTLVCIRRSHGRAGSVPAVAHTLAAWLPANVFSFFLPGPIDIGDLFWIIFRRDGESVRAPFPRVGKKIGIRADRCMAFW